ncbi:MAG: hypothetical protein K8R46_08485 [Pirellulales bacterium]|nr:hypothetical protein [Pirellulales bacterium]
MTRPAHLEVGWHFRSTLLTDADNSTAALPNGCLSSKNIAGTMLVRLSHLELHFAHETARKPQCPRDVRRIQVSGYTFILENIQSNV